MENLSLKNDSWEFPGRTVVRTQYFHGWGWSSIPGQGTDSTSCSVCKKQLHRCTIYNQKQIWGSLIIKNQSLGAEDTLPICEHGGFTCQKREVLQTLGTTVGQIRPIIQQFYSMTITEHWLCASGPLLRCIKGKTQSLPWRTQPVRVCQLYFN